MKYRVWWWHLQVSSNSIIRWSWQCKLMQGKPPMTSHDQDDKDGHDHLSHPAECKDEETRSTDHSCLIDRGYFNYSIDIVSQHARQVNAEHWNKMNFLALLHNVHVATCLGFTHSWSEGRCASSHNMGHKASIASSGPSTSENIEIGSTAQSFGCKATADWCATSRIMPWLPYTVCTEKSGQYGLYLWAICQACTRL